MLFKKKKRTNLGVIKYKSSNYKRFRNPLRIKKGIFKFKLFKVINLILIIGILASLYFFILSDFYNITNVEVSSNQIISTDDILEITNNYLTQKRLLVFKNKNIFLFNRNKLGDKINEVVILEDLKIEKILPNTIRITLNEKDAAIKWLTNQQEYLVDKNGLIIKRFYKLATPGIFQLTGNNDVNNQNQKADNFLKINNLANENINLNDHVLTNKNIDFIFNLEKEISDLDYLDLKEITVPNNFPQYLTIKVNNGWQIHFNLVDSIDNQLNRLTILINEKIQKGNLSGLDYIDLRLGESIYYKMK